jgi:hypothetical protein
LFKRLERFYNRHAGKRAVIVCNGPSLKQMDLGFLKNEHTFGLNKIFLGVRQFGFYPRYLVAVNANVIKQAAGSIASMPCVKFIGSAGHSVIREDALTYHLNTVGLADRFSRDIVRGAHEGWTVTHVALQIAFYMGFTQVVIIGLDHRFEQDGIANQPVVRIGDDANHFHHEYFADGQEWDNPDLHESEISFSVAKELFERNGREIIDATQGGGCTIFPKRKCQEIFTN